MAPPSGPRALIRGIVAVLAVASAAVWVGRHTAPYGIDAAALAVAFGLVLGNLAPPRPALRPGIGFAAKRALTAAVVLLGLAVTWDDLLGLGVGAFGAVLVAVAGSLALAMLLAPLFGVSRPLALLLGLGTGVCGVSAIAAGRSTVGAADEEVTYAVATVTLLGTAGLLVYPLVQAIWHPFHAPTYGLVAGATLHSVPQAVGAAVAGGGAAAFAAAAVVKLARVALLGPALVAAGWMARGGSGGRLFRALPVEVWGFLVLFVAGSLMGIPAGVRSDVQWAAKALLTVALAALGLSTRLSDLRATGARPFLLAAVVWGLVLAVLILAVRTAAA